MATTATLVIEAIEAAIAAVTPTLDAPAFGKAFVLGEDTEHPTESPAPSGWTRRFFVDFLSGTGEHEDGVFHPTEENTLQEFLVTVVYPIERNLRVLQKLIRSDVRDLRAALANPAVQISGVSHQWVPRWDAPEPAGPTGALVADRFLQRFTVVTQFHESTL